MNPLHIILKDDPHSIFPKYTFGEMTREHLPGPLHNHEWKHPSVRARTLCALEPRYTVSTHNPGATDYL